MHIQKSIYAYIKVFSKTACVTVGSNRHAINSHYSLIDFFFKKLTTLLGNTQNGKWKNEMKLAKDLPKSFI